jgi:hypothetical protein
MSTYQIAMADRWRNIAISLIDLVDPEARRVGTRRSGSFCCPTGLVLFFALTQDLRPFDFAQGRLWAIACRPYGAGNGRGNQRAHFASSVRVLVGRFQASR